MRDKKNRWKTINDGLPLGSMLVPTLFNLKINDLLVTTRFKFQYVDDTALAYQSKDMTIGEKVLTDDLKIMNDYFYKWRPNLNPFKTEVCAFHFYNKQAEGKLLEQFNVGAANDNF